MATETDAARLRVLEARTDLEEQLLRLQATGREALDIPAKIKRSPAKAAAVVGGVGFLALKGPQRLFGAARRVVRGKPEPLPERMLPDEIEKALRRLGSDGEKVRGALERDFADYAKSAARSRQGVRTLVLLGIVRPLVQRGAKAAAELLFSADSASLSARLAEIRERAEHAARARTGADTPGTTPRVDTEDPAARGI